ncbi:MAG: NAD(P)/FAD-dependent oxidoreductase [Pseudomonadota bacterium]
MAALECDYLIIGAGAVGMAFVDTLLDESDATVLMVDDHHQPGGHWNDAYPFVRLHQPSHFYGVASTPLGSMHVDKSGSNAGYFELASGAEVLSYFEQVMRQRFLPSGRVQYFPLCRYLGDRRFESLVSGEVRDVRVRRRVVDSTYFKTSVPSRHERAFEVAADVRCVAPNALPLAAGEHRHYCIVGAGKTAMDTGVWLLDSGARPEQISWICPRGSWLMNRAVTQASVEFFEQSIGGFAAQLEAAAAATSVDDLFERLEACDFLLRIDRSVPPEMFHFAVISTGEVEQLRRIEHVVRGQRVTTIDAAGVALADRSRVDLPPETLYIDCTASAVDFKAMPTGPAFAPERITIMPVRMPNPCLSAAVIAFLEANYDDDDKRNSLSQPVPPPDDRLGWLRTTLGNMMNQAIWSQEPALSEFVTNCRLDGFGAVIRDADLSIAENAALVQRMRDAAIPAAANLQRLLEASAS